MLGSLREWQQVLAKHPSVGVDAQNLSIIYYLFSSYPVFINRVPAFFSEDYFIYVSSIRIKHSKDYLFLSTSALRKLHLKDTWMYLITQESLVPKKYHSMLEVLPDEEFFDKIKLLLLGMKPIDVLESDVEASDSIFTLFSKLFSGFAEILAVYQSIGKSHKYIFGCILSMLLKLSVLGKSRDLSKGYEKVLYSLRSYMPVITKSVEEYMLSSQTEMDFYRFMFRLSNERNAL